MTAKRKVICPYCKSEQEEPETAVSTYCHACKRHIPIRGARRRKASIAPKQTRIVVCRECGYTDKIVADAMSTQCENCSAYLDLRSHVIKGGINHKLVTYGDVTFLPGSSYEGPPIRAGKIIVGGRVSAIIKADVELEIQESGKVNNPFEAPIIRILHGAHVTVGQIRTRSLEIAAKVITGVVEASDQIVILPGGLLVAQKVTTRFIDVQPGGALLTNLEIVPGNGAPNLAVQQAIAEEEAEEETREESETES